MVGLRFHLKTVLGFVALIALTIFVIRELGVLPNSTIAVVTSFPIEDFHEGIFTMYGYDESRRLRVAIMGVHSEFTERVRVDPAWNGRMKVTIDGSVLTYSSGVTLVFLTNGGFLVRDCSLKELDSYLIGNELFNYPEDVWQQLGPSNSWTNQHPTGEPSVSADDNAMPQSVVSRSYGNTQSIVLPLQKIP